MATRAVVAKSSNSKGGVGVIVQASQNSKLGFQAYGAAAELWRYKGHEAILSGPYETGKTFSALQKLNALLCKYPFTRALMLRQTYASLVNSAVITYEQKVLAYPPDDPKSVVQKLGRNHPEAYFYPNGSALILGGLDNPAKFLSAEFDYIYVNQAEELSLNDWEIIVGRATGRAGNAPYPQIIADCNPGPPSHWILSRESLRLFESRHEDNPVLYNHETNEWTAQGKQTLEILDGLTGLRYKRGRLGLWVAAEGQVYEYDPSTHLVDWFEIPKSWPRFRVIDFGYTNPFVCQWWAIDDDGRMYMYRELYHTHRTVRVHAEQITELSKGEVYLDTVCDHDAEGRATLEEHEIYSVAAKKSILVGIESVEERLKNADDGQPRIFFLRNALVEPDISLMNAHKPYKTVDEFGSYVYPSSRKGRALQETPVKLNDHGMDCVRYGVQYLEESNQSLLLW